MSTSAGFSLAALLIAASSLAQAQSPGETPAQQVLAGRYGFESDAEISGWTAGNAGLRRSDAHFKDGTHSLQWDWKKNAVLEMPSLQGLKQAGDVYPGGQPEIYEPSFYPKARFGGLKMWLYQQAPTPGEMVFQVGSDAPAARKNPKYRFAVRLNFTGWRAVWVAFEEDAKVEGYNGGDEMQAMVAYPRGTKAGAGRIFIDHLDLLRFVSNKRNSDAQFVNAKRNDLRAADAYEILKPWQALGALEPSATVDAQQLARDSGQIAERLRFLILGDETQDWKARESGIDRGLADKIKAAHAYYDKLNLDSERGVANGVPLFGIRDEHPAERGLVFDDVAQATMFPLAMDYKLNGNAAARQKLLTLLDYFLDQGWAAGSSIGTVDHVIKMAPIATAIFLLQDDLKVQGKLQPLVEMLAWHTRVGGLLQLDRTRGENSDKVRGGALAKLIAILLIDDPARKQELLLDYKRYMDYVATVSPGYSDTFKPDFSIYHHRGTYLNTYGTNALNTMALIHWLLQDTPYAMSAQSTATIKQVLVRQAQIAFGVRIHHGLGGRIPLGNSSIEPFTLPAYAYMSLDGDKVSDPHLASLFNYLYSIADAREGSRILQPSLTYSGTFGTLDLMVRLHRQMGASMAKPEDGVVVMPFSAFMAYRHGNAFAGVKGYNNYVWDYESGKGENNLGRYLSHGMLVVARGDARDGFAGLDMNEGFDWSMLPGATTKMLPADTMLYFTSPDSKYQEGKHRNFSESVVASGVRQEGSGLFGFDLRDDVSPDQDKSLFDASFRAKKSYFFVGDEIICLGSGVRNDDARYRTVTTLFQYRSQENKKNFFDGKAIGEGAPVRHSADGGWFADQNGVHYVVPRGFGVSMVNATQSSYKAAKVGDQKSIVLEDRKDYQQVNATYTKAWIDHGSAPSNQGYEYEILLDATATQAAKHLREKTYEVLQKDEAAHVVKHKASATTAYAIFQANAPLPGIVQSADIPLLAMVKARDDGLLLTIANPDLQQAKWNHNMSSMPDAINNAWAKGGVATVVLKGEWYLTGPTSNVMSATTNAGNTVLVVYGRDGESVDIPLQHRVAGSGDE